jgi:integrase/recombinase XerD
MGTLRAKMEDVMDLCGLADGTRVLYLKSVENLAVYFKRSPDELTLDEVQRYLMYLIKERGYAPSTYKGQASALRFFFERVLGRTDVHLWVPRRRQPQKLPEVLNHVELNRLFAAATHPRDKALLMTPFACGLRVSEVSHLRISDIDSVRMLVRVREGKGNKERYTVLHQALLVVLRRHWSIGRPQTWLFPGDKLGQPITSGSVLRIYKKAMENAGITKRGGIHCLRHCFATYLLEQGVELRVIQALMGHRSITSTARYTHLVANKIGEEYSLLDLVSIRDKRPMTRAS